MVQIKAELIVKGKVQKRGYRDHVQEVARDLDVKGYVENLRDGSVKIVCETEEATLKKFIQAISLKTDIVIVEKVEIIRTQPAKGEYEFFEIKYGPLEEEMGERLAAAFTIAAATRQDIKNVHGDLKNMHGELKDMHVDLKDMHVELKDTRGELKDINVELKGMRNEMKGMHSGMKNMHQDLKSGIESMHDSLKSSINSMHNDMNRHFEEMAKRYDAISAELLRTREELKRSVDILVELVHKFLEKS